MLVYVLYCIHSPESSILLSSALLCTGRARVFFSLEMRCCAYFAPSPLPSHPLTVCPDRFFPPSLFVFLFVVSLLSRFVSPHVPRIVSYRLIRLLLDCWTAGLLIWPPHSPTPSLALTLTLTLTIVSCVSRTPKLGICRPIFPVWRIDLTRINFSPELI